MWTEPRTTFSGRHYQLKDAMCEPKPLQQPRIPLWIGGSGERVTLRHVAAEADGWNTFLMPVEEFDHKLDVLDAHCRDVGRDRSDIRGVGDFLLMARPPMDRRTLALFAGELASTLRA